MENFLNLDRGRLLMVSVTGRYFSFDADDMSVGLHFLLQRSHELWYNYMVWPKILDQGDTVAIVGSNYGWHDIHVKAIVEHGRVVSFEPNPLILPFLRRNFLMNAMAHEICEDPVSDGVYPVQLSVMNGDWGGSYIGDPIEPNRLKPRHVFNRETISLSTYFQNDRLDVVKIDAEGSEAKVIRGVKGRIDDGSLKAIIYENNLDYWNPDFDFLHEEMKNNGTYVPFRITEQVTKQDHRPLREMGNCDIMMLRRDLLPRMY